MDIVSLDDSPLNARDFSKLSMNMENSLRFSGSTNWPGGCDPEKTLRYPLKMSMVFSVMPARTSFRVLSDALAAARE